MNFTPATPLITRMQLPRSRRQAGAYISDGLDVDGPWHVHDMHQLLYAFEGAVEVEGEHARFVVPCQLAAWIPAGVVHRTHIHRVRSGSIFFQPDMVTGPGGRVRVVLVPPLMREMVMGAMRWPMTQPEQPIGRKYFQALAMLCAEWLEAETRLLLPTSSDARIRRVMDHTRQNLAKVDLAAVCHIAGLSQRSLRRHFRAATGITWEEYRRHSRLAQAIVLLGDTRLTIGSIALRVGFESQGAFARALQASIGERPSDYRKRIHCNKSRSAG